MSPPADVPASAPPLAPAPLAPAPVATRGGALDALRLAASLLIVLYHFGAEGPWRLERVHPVFARGYLATDFFLMLSGYVLGRAYGNHVLSGRVGALNFWLRRAARIWPGHLMVLAAFVVAVLGFVAAGSDVHSPTRFQAPDLVKQALLVHAWGLPGPLGDGWNLPSWSLSALIVCYAAFPVLWRGLAKAGWPAVLPLIGVAALLAVDGMAWRVFGRPVYDLQFNVGVVRAAPLFVLGACLARAVDLSWPSVAVARALMWGGLVGVVVIQALGRFDIGSVLCIAAVVLGAGRLPVARPSVLIEKGAQLSFALFITHTFTGFLWFTASHAVIRVVPIWLGVQWGMWWLSFPAAFGVAWLFHHYLDQPVQKKLAPYLKSRPGRYPAPAPSGSERPS